MKSALYEAPAFGQAASSPIEFPRVRRSPRKPAFIRVWLRLETGPRIWEEETQTQVLSRHGAALECRHAVQPGEVLAIIRRDNGQRVNGRVAYCHYNSSGDREIGLELLGSDNFWNLSWESVASHIVQAENSVADSPARAALPAIVAESPGARRGPERIDPMRSNGDQGPETERVVSAAGEAQPPRKRRHRDEVMLEQLVPQERRLWAAIQEKDAARLRSLLAEDLVWVSPNGVSTNRLEFEKFVSREWTDRTPAEFEVTRINKAAAIVTYETSSTAADPSPAASRTPETPSLTYHSSVWIRRGGRWWVVLHQQTPGKPDHS